MHSDPVMRWRHRLSLVLLAVVASASGAEPAGADDVPQFALPQALRSFANSHSIPITGFDSPVADGSAAPGDTISAMITLRGPKRVSQWLCEFRADRLTAEEAKKTKAMTVTMTTTSKRTYSFSAGQTLALEIRTIGPFIEGQTGPLGDQHARTLISPEMLALGIDPAARALLAMHGKPKDTEVPPELERGVAGFFPAMMAFFTAVEKTPGLREVLWNAIEKPSVWSLVKRLGRPSLDLGLDNASEVPAPLVDFNETVVRKMSVNLQVNAHPALNCVFYVTTPRPPLLTTAGVIRIAAVKPDRNDVQLEVRLLASRLATDRKSASEPRATAAAGRPDHD